MRKVISFLCLLAIGCATPYASTSYVGGYSETRMAPDVFRVRFNGNGFTSSERALDFALLRAADLTLRNGYSYYVIVQESSWVATSTHKTRETTTTTGSAHTYGNTTRFSANTVTYGGYTYNVSKPRAENTILCLKEKPSSGLAYDAQFVSNEIRRKYDLGGIRRYSNTQPISSTFSSPAPIQPRTLQISSRQESTPSSTNSGHDVETSDISGNVFNLGIGAGLPTFTTFSASELEENRVKKISDAFEVPVNQITGFRWGYRMEAGQRGRWYTLFYLTGDNKYQETVRVDQANIIVSRDKK